MNHAVARIVFGRKPFVECACGFSQGTETDAELGEVMGNHIRLATGRGPRSNLRDGHVPVGFTAVQRMLSHMPATTFDDLEAVE
jgi:hypothetical protein